MRFEGIVQDSDDCDGATATATEVTRVAERRSAAEAPAAAAHMPSVKLVAVVDAAHVNVTGSPAARKRCGKSGPFCSYGPYTLSCAAGAPMYTTVS